jgi:3-deoxy-manno-octulosonate cytidylyltransferase (CMP-KDO synthetase)
MKAIGIIPARMDSSRFPGKPMSKLMGMPMIGHCYHRTRLAHGLECAYVATCDEVIASYVQSIGGVAVMTSTAHNRATTRTAEALEIVERETGQRFDVVVMVQGDEPLISSEAIGETLHHFKDPTVNIVNVMSRMLTLESFVDKNNVKVVVNHRGDALYFSREPIPSPWKGWEHLPCYMQTGIIAFRHDVLIDFNAIQETALEQYESVDMNRVIETGGSIRMAPIEDFTIGVDTPEELVEAEALLHNDPTVSRYLSL